MSQALEIQSLKRLKIILQFNKIFIILLLLTIIYVLYFTVIKKYHSSYDNPSSITGTIIDYSLKNNQLSMIIKANEKFKATYYFKSEDEITNIKDNICLGCTITLTGVKESISKNTILLIIKNMYITKKYILIIK